MSNDALPASQESEVKKRHLKYDCPYGTACVMMTTVLRLWRHTLRTLKLGLVSSKNGKLELVSTPLG